MYNIVAIADLPDGDALLTSDWIPIQRGATVMKATLDSSGFILLAAQDLTTGQALTINGSGEVILARANSAPTSNCIGFADKNIFTGEVVTFSKTYATTIPPLTIGAYYYLSSSSAGLITTTPPTSGNYLVPVGVAIGLNTLLINIQAPVLIT